MMFGPSAEGAHQGHHRPDDCLPDPGGGVWGARPGDGQLLDRLARGEKPSELNRRLKAGTVLVREYLGERHTVTVVPDGFLWADKTYSSLSAIAQAITGTTWNGPRFFGLRMAREPDPRSPNRRKSRRTFKA